MAPTYVDFCKHTMNPTHLDECDRMCAISVAICRHFSTYMYYYTVSTRIFHVHLFLCASCQPSTTLTSKMLFSIWTHLIKQTNEMNERTNKWMEEIKEKNKGKKNSRVQLKPHLHHYHACCVCNFTFMFFISCKCKIWENFQNINCTPNVWPRNKFTTHKICSSVLTLV